jgi:hypothetical protein
VADQSGVGYVCHLPRWRSVADRVRDGHSAGCIGRASDFMKTRSWARDRQSVAMHLHADAAIDEVTCRKGAIFRRGHAPPRLMRALVDQANGVLTAADRRRAPRGRVRAHRDARRRLAGGPTALADSGSGVSSISTGASSTNAGGALGGADVASGQVRTTATTRIACNATDIATPGAPSIRPDLRDRGCPRAKCAEFDRHQPKSAAHSGWLCLVPAVVTRPSQRSLLECYECLKVRSNV